MPDAVWGIDLGGTKIEGVVLSAGGSVEPLCRIRLPTEAERGYAHILGQIRKLVEAMEGEVGHRPVALGIGTPGVLDPETLRIKNSNTTCLIDQPLKTDLETDLDVRLELANDANCFALAEARLGAARGLQSCFGVIMGTGVGGGIVVGDRALFGCQGIAGEWGHNSLDAAGPECYCGRRGCVETFISGPRLESFYAELAGEARSLPEIVARAEGGADADASATVERLVFYFGKALATVVNILDPHAVVLGGGVSNVDALYTKGVDAMKPWVFNDALLTPVLKNELGDSAGVFGAAMLVA